VPATAAYGSLAALELDAAEAADDAEADAECECEWSPLTDWGVSQGCV
jgi:hypothetical protein